MSIFPEFKASADSICLSELFPFDLENKDPKFVQNSLKNYRCLADIAKTALENYIKGIYPDPLVGENACQIRAVYYCQLFQEITTSKALSELIFRIDEITKNIDSIKLTKEWVVLPDILSKNKAEIRFPKELKDQICWIVYGYILTIAKDTCVKVEKKSDKIFLLMKEKNVPKKLPLATNTWAQKVIEHGKMILSRLSIQYLRSELISLPQEELTEKLSSAFEKQVLTDELGIQSAPILPGTMILLNAMKTHNLAIVLRDRIIIDGDEDGSMTLNLLYIPIGPKKTYEEVKDFSLIDKNQGAVIFDAIAFKDKPCDLSEIAACINKIGIDTILLCVCATHPAYGGTQKGIEPTPIPEIDDKRESLRKVALSEGLCADNPQLCWIYHVFAGTVGLNFITDKV